MERYAGGDGGGGSTYYCCAYHYVPTLYMLWLYFPWICSASVHRLWQAAMEEEAKEAAAVDPEAGAAITRLDELWGIMARDEE